LAPQLFDLAMIFESRTNLLLAASLSCLAGFNDAVGFQTLGGFFVSFMSGNSTRLAVNLSAHDWSLRGLLPLGIIVLFIVGVMIGTLIRGTVPRRKQVGVLAFVTAALAAAALLNALSQNAAAVALMVIAMGASNNVFVKEGEVSVGVTYMTGTLVKLGQRLAGRAIGSQKPWHPYLVLWLGLLLGAVAGSLSYSLLDLQCLWIAFGLAAALLLTYFFGAPGEAP
jgi:uncharacterized membrane protein YoaK (UPF0700 family)